MSNLNRSDDTNTSPTLKNKKDCWDYSVKNDEDVKILSEDGSFIGEEDNDVETNPDDGITPDNC